ncbi:MAG: hypothetical protein SVR08_05655 [Spirochaetota bacterium]|nr:hypothetical protein [Spirochaetota bacterium]
MLNNGSMIRLLGIKERPEKYDEAAQFLKDMTNGKRVFIKTDNIKYDDDNNMLCYLYLSNRTFLILHLIKFDLVDVCLEFDYKYKSKFIAKTNSSKTF